MDAATIAAALERADQRLDVAWIDGGDVQRALAVAKRLSIQVGRDPVIEDAKVLMAEANRCTPSEAFAFMVKISQRTNTKLALVAHRIVASLNDPPIEQ